MQLSYIEKQPYAQPNCSIIWLHGLGASGHDFEPIVERFQFPPNHLPRFIFPHAPIQAVTLNNGMQMPSWYDIHGLDLESEEDIDGIARISIEINNLIENEISIGIASNRIVLAGFSQGGALALYTGLSCEHPLAGIIALSCYLPLRHSIDSWSAAAEKTLPILLAHGRMDDVVPVAFAELAKEILIQQQFSVSFNEYDCAHNVCEPELDDIQNWLIKILK